MTTSCQSSSGHLRLSLLILSSCGRKRLHKHKSLLLFQVEKSHRTKSNKIISFETLFSSSHPSIIFLLQNLTTMTSWEHQRNWTKGSSLCLISSSNKTRREISIIFLIHLSIEGSKVSEGKEEAPQEHISSKGTQQTTILYKHAQVRSRDEGKTRDQGWSL